MAEYRRQRAAAVLIEGESIALIERHWDKRDPPHYFVFPGGGIEEGETPEQAIIREMREELGVGVEPLQLIARVEFPDAIMGPSLQHFFHVKIVGGEFGTGEWGPESRAADQGGTYAARWVPIQDLKSINVYPREIADHVTRYGGEGWPRVRTIVELGSRPPQSLRDVSILEGDEEPLSGGMVSEVSRVGNTVRRRTQRWTEAVHHLLRHLESVGFQGSPRVLGFDDKGREILSWMEGSPANYPWPEQFRSDDGLANLGRLLKQFHDAVANYRPPDDLEWCIGRKSLGQNEILCHGDLGPWNTIWRNGEPVAFIDWDFAEPAPATTDLGHMAFYSVPLRNDDACLQCGFDVVPDRNRRLRALCDGYGTDDLNQVVDSAERYLMENIRRMREFGPMDVTPWKGFVDRGFLEEDRERLDWLRANRRSIVVA